MTHEHRLSLCNLGHRILLAVLCVAWLILAGELACLTYQIFMYGEWTMLVIFMLNDAIVISLLVLMLKSLISPQK